MRLNVLQIGRVALAFGGSKTAAPRKRMGLCASAGLIALAAGPARAAVITEAAIPPASFEIDQTVSNGTPNGGHDFTNNGGPPAQSFTPATAFSLNAVTILGGNGAGGQDQYGSTTDWTITIGSVNESTKKVTVLDSETVAGFWPSQANDYLTFTLGSPVALSANTEYSFAISTISPYPGGGSNPWAYYALAESTTGAVAGQEYAFEEGSASGVTAPVGSTDSITNPEGYNYTFYVQGSPVPEPASLGVLALGAVCALRRWPRRRGSTIDAAA